MSAHDELRRQLLKSVAARGSTAPAPGRGRLRLRGRPSGLAIAVLALAVGGGVAGAATQLLSGPGARERARSLVQTAVVQSSRNAACQEAPVSFVDDEPPAAVRAVFGLRTTPLSTLEEALVRRQARGVVLSRSVRLVSARGGRRVLAYVSGSGGAFAVADRSACDRARRARLLELHPGDDAVRRLARRRLADEQRVLAPRGQLLFVTLFDRHSSAGASAGVSNGDRAVPTGVLFSSTSAGYAGISVPRAKTVRVSTTDPHSRRPLRRTYPVRERLFAFTLPRYSGPVEVRQLAADGRTLAVETQREPRTRQRR